MSENPPVGVPPVSTGGGRFQFAGLGLLVLGATLAFALTVIVPPVAFGAGVLLVAVALRRGLDGFGMFTVGFGIWLAVYLALAVVNALK